MDVQLQANLYLLLTFVVNACFLYKILTFEGYLMYRKGFCTTFAEQIIKSSFDDIDLLRSDIDIPQNSNTSLEST